MTHPLKWQFSTSLSLFASNSASSWFPSDGTLTLISFRSRWFSLFSYLFFFFWFLSPLLFKIMLTINWSEAIGFLGDQIVEDRKSHGFVIHNMGRKGKCWGKKENGLLLFWEILLNMLKGTSNCQNILQKFFFNKICSCPIFCQNETKIPIKLITAKMCPLKKNYSRLLISSSILFSCGFIFFLSLTLFLFYLLFLSQSSVRLLHLRDIVVVFSSCFLSFQT